MNVLVLTVPIILLKISRNGLIAEVGIHLSPFILYPSITREKYTGT